MYSMNTNPPEKRRRYAKKLLSGIPIAILGLLISAAGFYEISSFKEGEGSVWGLVAFAIGAILLLIGLFKALGISWRGLLYPYA